MKTIKKTYRFALRPTKEQEILVNKHFDCVHFLYNHFLNEGIERYRERKTSDTYYRQAASSTSLKKQDDTVWLKEINNQCLQTALRNLDAAFVNFYIRRATFPRFKSKRTRNGAMVPQFVEVAHQKVCSPKFKEGIKRCTLIKSSTVKFFESIRCEVPHKPIPQTSKQVGLDLGIPNLIVTSDDLRFRNHRFLTQYKTALAKAQQHLSRKVTGSASWERQRIQVAAIYEKIANTRLELLHKVSSRIINEYDAICIEDLNVKGMVADRRLAKHIADASWGTFGNLLEYKAAWNDKQLVRIGRFCPSRKTCQECGDIHWELKLSERTWTCKNGHVLDRDVNASKNILKRRIKNNRDGTFRLHEWRLN